jgi:hypothetical protein
MQHAAQVAASYVNRLTMQTQQLQFACILTAPHQQLVESNRGGGGMACLTAAPVDMVDACAKAHAMRI